METDNEEYQFIEAGDTTFNADTAMEEFGRQLAGGWEKLGSGGTYSVPRMKNGRVNIGISTFSC